MDIDPATQTRHEAIRQRAREVSARARLLGLRSPDSTSIAAEYAALPTGHGRWAVDRAATAAEDTHDTLRRMEGVLCEIRDGVRALAGPPALPATAPPSPPTAQADGPISSWLEVARAVGVDDSTIRAHRRRTRDRQQPYFADADAARAWYARLVAAPDHVPGPSGRSKVASGSKAAGLRTRKPRDVDASGVVDWSKVDV